MEDDHAPRVMRIKSLSNHKLFFTSESEYVVPVNVAGFICYL